VTLTLTDTLTLTLRISLADALTLTLRFQLLVLNLVFKPVLVFQRLMLEYDYQYR